MSSDNLPPNEVPIGYYSPVPDEYVIPELVEEIQPAPPPPTPRSPRWLWPLGLLLATIASTYFVGWYEKHGAWEGAVYCLSVMTILICHEAGHFIQARRYGVHSSLPYFLPMPMPPIGTMGAVIRMSSNIPNRKALFDIGITGPLAGLVPTLIFTVVGIMLSKPVDLANVANLANSHDTVINAPWLMEMIEQWRFTHAPNLAIDLHPLAHAGWVGLLITSLNLFPIGQLDGGHVLYAILRRGAHVVAILLLAAAIVAVIFLGFGTWTLMLFLLVLMGPRHPPTADDQTPLGVWRIVLGLLTLAFLPFGFTPVPIAR
jgi:membrane-associated protease RseP (regulator of RpoE activity)